MIRFRLHIANWLSFALLILALRYSGQKGIANAFKFEADFQDEMDQVNCIRQCDKYRENGSTAKYLLDCSKIEGDFSAKLDCGMCIDCPLYICPTGDILPPDKQKLLCPSVSDGEALKKSRPTLRKTLEDDDLDDSDSDGLQVDSNKTKLGAGMIMLVVGGVVFGVAIICCCIGMLMHRDWRYSSWRPAPDARAILIHDNLMNPAPDESNPAGSHELSTFDEMTKRDVPQ